MQVHQPKQEKRREAFLGLRGRVERNVPRSKDTWHDVQIGSRTSVEKNILTKQIEHPTNVTTPKVTKRSLRS